MASPSSNFLFFFLFSTLFIYSSGNLVGFSYNARGNKLSESSSALASETISFLNLNKNVSSTQISVSVADQRVLNLTSLSNSTVSVDLYLNLSLVMDLMQSEISTISWLEKNVITVHPHVKIKNIILSCSSEEFEGKNVFPLIFSALKSFNSILNRIHVGMKVKVSVAFPLPLLENLNTSHRGEIKNIFGFIRKTGSFVMIEAGIDEKFSLEDLVVHSLIKKAIKATSVFPDSDLLIALVMESPLVPSARDLVELTERIRQFFENILTGDRVDELYVEIEKIFPFSSRRKLLNMLKETIHGTFNPVNPTPTIVTVPSTNPSTLTPTNPATYSPLPIPSTTPANNPPATPVNPTTITVPGAQPVTNPGTTFPAPPGNVPGANPVTTPPVSTNAPAIPGQSWCVAKTGVSETALQAALDYACGMGGADCSLIQQGGSCYNPNSLQNHASYAFNSYYQKNRSPTSCDFGGNAMIVNTNPSTGSCVYPTSLSSTPTSTTPPAQPVSTAPPATPTPITTASPPPGIGIPGSVPPPTVLNSSAPGSIFGVDSPPFVNTSTSSSGTQLRINLTTLVTTLITGIIIMVQGQN